MREELIEKKSKRAKQVKVKKNGCSCPFHCYQILGLLSIFYNCYNFYFIWLPSFYSYPGYYITMLSIYTAILGVQLILYLYTSAIDPTDPLVKEEKAKIEGRESIESNSEMNFCNICFTHVSKNAHHCKRCNRCVNDFDHHCKWINNCVGGENYCAFIVLISFTFAWCLVHIINNIIFFCYLNNKGKINLFNFYKVDLWIMWLIFVIISTIIQLSSLIYLIYLIIFHIYIYNLNLSTYYYLKGYKKKSIKKKSKNKHKDEEMVVKKKVKSTKKKYQEKMDEYEDEASNNLALENKNKKYKKQNKKEDHFILESDVEITSPIMRLIML